MITSREALAAAVAVAAAGCAAAGCAAVPTSGAVQQFGGAADVSQQQEHSQPIPVGPGRGWSADQIVEGFIWASASFANNYAVAREYLDPTAQRTWNPGWAVTVVSSMTPATVSSYPPKQFVGSQPGGVANVLVNGLQVPTLTNTGRSQAAASPKARVTFVLTKISGQWRITNPPPTLLLYQDDFREVYQPQNVYFLGSSRTLVPDAVFVPQQDTNAQLATGLVDALLRDPAGWLQGAATTGFPRNSNQISPVRINGPNATVDLGGKAATASRLQQEQMAAQLAWTLTSGPTGIQAVELEINGRPLPIAGSFFQLLDTYSSWMPSPSGGSSLYYIGSRGTVKKLSGVGPPGSEQLGQVAPVTGAPGVPGLRSVAVSPDGRWIAGIAGAGKVVYAWDLIHKSGLRKWISESGTCTSLSWDQRGDLWITAGGAVWMLPPGKSVPSPVPLVSPAGAQVTAFVVAPDGIRAVMIVNGGQLQLVAILHSGSPLPELGVPVAIGSGISDPKALSWYDANDVIVLDGSSSGGQLYEVPLNGGAPSGIASEGSIVSVTATSPNIAVGQSDGQVMVSANLGAFESTHATGKAPVYPG
jgi:hypothetical protein